LVGAGGFDLGADLAGAGFFGLTDDLDAGFAAFGGDFLVAGLTGLPMDFFWGVGTGFLVFLAMMVYGVT
jgi:hypothetical protein